MSFILEYIYESLEISAIFFKNQSDLDSLLHS